MHSTLRTELRGTQRVFGLLRPRPSSRTAQHSRSFSRRIPSQSSIDPTNGPKSQKSESINAASTETPKSVTEPALSDLGVQIEKWINRQHNRGKPLDVWNTIAEQDAAGKWRLSHQAKVDLQRINDANKFASTIDKLPGLKIDDGRITAISSDEIRELKNLRDRNSSGESVEQQEHMNDAVGHQQWSRSPDPHIIEPATQDPRTEHPASVLTPNSAHKDEGYLKEHVNMPKLYGSPAARRLRQRKVKEEEAPVLFVLPGWFKDRNVLLRHEKQLDQSIPDQVQPILASHILKSGGRVAYVFSNTQHAKIVQPVNESSRDLSTRSEPTEKEQTFSTGDDEGPDSSADNPSASKGPPGHGSPIVITLSDQNDARKYFIEEPQHLELLMSLKGRLRLPASGSFGIRGHLIIHYAATDGDLFLDRLVEDLARQTRCNLVTLDAQDISSLISQAEIDPMIVDEAKLMSYEVYNDIYNRRSSENSPPPSLTVNEVEEQEDDASSTIPQGLPFIVGKPITIDLKAIFDGKGGRRSRNPFGSKAGFMSDMLGQPEVHAKGHQHIFSSIVESVLASARNKTQSIKSVDTEYEHGHSQEGKNGSHPLSPPNDPTLIHIKEMKAIQDTSVGKQFLAELYEQIEQRRRSGERIMLVGTECAREEDAVYDKGRIRSLQTSDFNEFASSIVITPVRIGDNSTNPYEEDRDIRIATINARHLFEMMQTKQISLRALHPGFWTSDFLRSLHEADQDYLKRRLWSFSYVQRLAALLASEDIALSKSQFPVAEACSYLDSSDKSKFTWAKQSKRQQDQDSERGPKDIEKDRLHLIRRKANKHEKRLLSGIIEPKKMSTTFQDIHIPVETVDALQTLTTLSLVRPDAFRYGVLASDRIPGLLLYGPPGTGKTLAAKAVARESGATMLEVSAADINDMYVGEGEKNVKAIFSLAKKLAPCVVFLDEADAMFSARSNAGRRVSHRELLNQFLKEWDGMSNDSGSAFIMVATNRPMDLDDAVLRRLPRRLLIDLPTEQDRAEILKIHLRHEQIADDVSITQLAAKTPFYSGSDLKNVAVSAALNAVRKENEAAKQHENDEEYQYPTKRTLTLENFEKALEEVSASISEDMSSLKEIKKFDEQYGDKRGKKRRNPKWGFTSAAEADKVLETVKVRS